MLPDPSAASAAPQNAKRQRALPYRNTKRQRALPRRALAGAARSDQHLPLTQRHLARGVPRRMRLNRGAAFRASPADVAGQVVAALLAVTRRNAPAISPPQPSGWNRDESKHRQHGDTDHPIVVIVPIVKVMSAYAYAGRDFVLWGAVTRPLEHPPPPNTPRTIAETRPPAKDRPTRPARPVLVPPTQREIALDHVNPVPPTCLHINVVVPTKVEQPRHGQRADRPRPLQHPPSSSHRSHFGPCSADAYSHSAVRIRQRPPATPP